MVVRAAALDVDIVPGPETLTLKDPLSMKRIDLPCKSRWCQHTSCFDAATFLTLNEQTPTWSCPICNRAITTDEDLFIDGYISSSQSNLTVDISMIFLEAQTKLSNLSSYILMAHGQIKISIRTIQMPNSLITIEQR